MAQQEGSLRQMVLEQGEQLVSSGAPTSQGLWLQPQDPQSFGQVPQFSPLPQTPSPQLGPGQQSVAQELQVSPASHTLLPQIGWAQQSGWHV
jgi:hypothetical protein